MKPALQTVLEGKLLGRLSTTRKIPLTVHFLSDADVDFGTKSSLPLPYLMCVFSVLQTDGFYLKCSFSKELHVWISSASLLCQHVRICLAQALLLSQL